MLKINPKNVLGPIPFCVHPAVSPVFVGRVSGNSDFLSSSEVPVPKTTARLATNLQIS
jgi:hypothetical protein